MAESILSGVIVKLLEYMSRSTVEVIAPYLGGRCKLVELNKTMRLIQARLLDAERRCEGDNEAVVKEWLKRLKDLIYRLEDLFEEVAMADEGYDQIPVGKLIKHLYTLFSSSAAVKMNRKVAREANIIIEELKAISSAMFSLNLRVLSLEEQQVLISMNGRETYSFVAEEQVIGRNDDKKVIVQMLLDAEESMSIIPIIGIGGIGKTTLAQLAYNDENVQQHFELKGWACICSISSVEELARKILSLISPVIDEDYQQLNLEQLQSSLREVVDDKRFLLVLDDC